MVARTELPRNGIPVDPAIDYSHPLLRDPRDWTESEDEPAHEQSNSWLPVDMAAAMVRGEIVPDLGMRADGQLMLYKGKIHWFFGTYECGKTWAALFFAAQTLAAGGRVLYLDFEDDARGIGWRLVQIGVTKAVIYNPARFAYIRPEESLASAEARSSFEHSLSQEPPFDLVVLDGVTESIALEDLKDNQGGDIAKWQKLLPKSVAQRTGAAVVCLDHVPRDSDNHAMPIGSQHKMSGLDGAAYRFISVEKFAKGKIGKSTVRVSKDRPGGVRAYGVAYEPKDQSHWVGDFIMDARDSDNYAVKIAVPNAEENQQDSQEKTANERSTWCMERVLDRLLSDIGDSFRTQNAVVNYMHANVKGKGRKVIGKDRWRESLRDYLVEQGYVFQIEHGKALLHYGFAPFSELKDLPQDQRIPRAKQARAKMELHRIGAESDD